MSKNCEHVMKPYDAKCLFAQPMKMATDGMMTITYMYIVQVMLILIMKSFVSVLIRSPAYFSLASCYINSTAI